jgi:hypothetical protein
MQRVWAEHWFLIYQIPQLKNNKADECFTSIVIGILKMGKKSHMKAVE